MKELLCERKSLIDILALKPERIAAVQDEPLQWALSQPDSSDPAP